MTAPAFWGIDPELKYAWTPRRFRIEEDGADGSTPQDGAPVLLLKALPERLSIRLRHARERFFAAVSKARAKIEDADGAEEAIEAVLDRSEAIYSAELQMDALAACVVGWRNVIGRSGPIAFTGEWERDAQVLPASVKAELFNDLVSESAFTTEDREGFSSPQESTLA